MTNPPENQPPENPYAGRYGQNPSAGEPQNPYAGRYGQNPPGYEASQQQPPQYGQNPYGQQESGLPSAPPVSQDHNGERPPMIPQNFRVGDAIRFGWGATKATLGTWVVALILVVALGSAIIYATNRVIRDLLEVYQDIFTTGEEFDVDHFNQAVAQIPGLRGSEIAVAMFGMVMVGVLIAGVNHMALRAARGDRPTLGHLVAVPNFTKVLLTVTFMQVLNTVVGLIPGMGPLLQMIVTFLTMFTVYYVLDRGNDTFTALGGSMRLVGNNVGFVVVLALTSFGLVLLGAFAFIVGLLITLPIVICATAISYAVLSER